MFLSGKLGRSYHNVVILFIQKSSDHHLGLNWIINWLPVHELVSRTFVSDEQFVEIV